MAGRRVGGAGRAPDEPLWTTCSQTNARVVETTSSHVSPVIIDTRAAVCVTYYLSARDTLLLHPCRLVILLLRGVHVGKVREYAF